MSRVDKKKEIETYYKFVNDYVESTNGEIKDIVRNLRQLCPTIDADFVTDQTFRNNLLEALKNLIQMLFMKGKGILKIKSIGTKRV